MSTAPNKTVSMSNRLTLALVSAMTIVVVLVAIGDYFYTAAGLERSFTRKVEETLSYLDGTLAQALWKVDHGTVTRIAETTLHDDVVVGVTIWDEQKSEIYSTAEQGGGAAFVQTRSIHFKDELVGEMELHFSRALLSDTLNRILTNSFIVWLLVVSSTAVLTKLLVRKYFRGPLASFTDLAESYRKHPESPPANATPFLEFQPIEDVVKKLANDVFLKLRELEDHRSHLETEVAERTNDLQIARDEAEAARERAEIANQAKSAFLANMSHELRTPLNAVLGFSQIMQRQGVLPQTSRHLGMIRESGEHLLTLINDILDLSKIEAHKLKLDPQPIQLARFLETIAGIISARAELKDLELVYEPDPDLPQSVEADETRLRQILLNLLGNAVKFTDHGEVTLRASLQSDLDNASSATLRFEVEDTGIGLPPDKRETIFQPFEQVGDTIQRNMGTGLGLAISHNLVEAMGGALQVDSVEGKGSRFWFELTLPISEAPPQTASQERAISGYQGERRTALIVDDIFSNRAVLIDMLAPLGFKTIEAENGEEALDLARSTRPDIILMDRRMPVIDGLEAARRLKKTPGLEKTPLISTSASVSKEARAEVLEAGYDDILDKPITWNNLASKLETHLSLDWQYEDSETERVETEAFPLPPKESIEELARLVKLGSVNGITEWASNLAAASTRYQPLADAVLELAGNFDINGISALIEQSLRRKEE